MKKIKIEQPYIEYEKVKIYFKIPSQRIDSIQLSNSQFSLKYYYHNIKEPNYSKHYILDNDDYDLASEKAHNLIDDIDNYINSVKRTQIIKNFDLNFNITTNNNFIDDYLINKLAENYITNILNNKYKNYIINSKTIENNDMLKLFIFELTINDKKTIEYFLILNVFCINLSTNNYCNIEMKNMLTKMLLTVSFNISSE